MGRGGRVSWGSRYPPGAHVGPPVRLERQQTLRLEDADRLADRGAAEPEVARQLRLVDALAGSELALDDRLAQVARDLRRQRRWLLEAFFHRVSAAIAWLPAARRDDRALTIDCRLFSFASNSDSPRSRQPAGVPPRRVCAGGGLDKGAHRWISV